MSAELRLNTQPESINNALKIVFVGNVGSGKTTAVAVMSEVPVIGSEAKATEQDALHRKLTTTVGLEYGVAHINNTKLHTMIESDIKTDGFVVCVDNKAYPASLEQFKIYRVLVDVCAAQHNYIRVIDESGEDYLYPADYFMPITLTEQIALAILQAA